jgi:hypothetical protein
MSISFQLLFAQSHLLTAIADWCGIVGLAVGIISVGFTLRAWWIIRRIDNVLKIERNKRILFSLLPEYDNKFRNIKKNIDACQQIKNINRVKNDICNKINSDLNKIKIYCEEIEKRGGINIIHPKAFEELKKKAEEILSLVNNDFIVSNDFPQLKDKLKTLSYNLDEVISIIENFFITHELEINDGYKHGKNDSPVKETLRNDE